MTREDIDTGGHWEDTGAQEKVRARTPPLNSKNPCLGKDVCRS